MARHSDYTTLTSTGYLDFRGSDLLWPVALLGSSDFTDLCISLNQGQGLTLNEVLLAHPVYEFGRELSIRKLCSRDSVVKLPSRVVFPVDLEVVRSLNVN